MSNNQLGLGHVFVAFLGGAAAGAAAALLIAPKSGQEARKYVFDYLSEGKEKLEKVPEALKAASEVARQSIENLVKKDEEPTPPE